MNKLVLLTIGFLALGDVNAGAADRKVEFRDSKGILQGTSQTEGNKTVERDAKGLYTGSSVRNGDTMNYYDDKGLYKGSSKIQR